MLTRGIFAALTLTFTGIGLVGAVVPGLPTVPFLLVAAACGRRGWPEWSERLERHPRWGPALVAWRRDRVISVSAKCLATVMMLASLAAATLAGADPAVSVVAALLFAGVLAWIWSRPHGPRSARIADSRDGAG